MSEFSNQFKLKKGELMIEEILKHCRRGSGGRRFLTAEQKRLIVEFWQQSHLPGAEFCRRYDLILTLLYKWRRDAIRGAKMGIQNNGELHSEIELETLRKENEELKKALGEATLDIKILKKKLDTDAKRQGQNWKVIPESLK